MKSITQTIGLFLLLVFFDIGRYWFVPDVNELQENNPETTAFMQYRQRQWENEGNEKSISKDWVPLTRISRYVQEAVLISEDDKFWEHDGFDYEAIEFAIGKNIEKRRFAFGASTITQQLAKNLYLSPSRNPVRKIKEAILTWRLERSLPKKRILEIYLNVVEWGDGIFGIEKAALYYYGKSARSLTARQAASLAAVLPNPQKFRPDGASPYVRRKAERIYRIMRKREVVSFAKLQPGN
ncbi:monofunctional biosynthetic peptidoglycan transglycosylase [Prosthecochloris sp.]|uniref:monofunctional biosynthetic peptidoglycan transglycosylase n=1 Tax=Prosthecochloris sp. TaxID=290513 RepID=UPI0025CEA639|nr:monofunctional biosynthetic peptidoglycan transglycosylase [Prosthecochloris sp.]